MFAAAAAAVFCCCCCYDYYLGEELSSLKPPIANQLPALRSHERCGHSNKCRREMSVWVLPWVWALLVSLVPSQSHPLSPTAHHDSQSPPSLLFILPTNSHTISPSETRGVSGFMSQTNHIPTVWLGSPGSRFLTLKHDFRFLFVHRPACEFQVHTSLAV